MEAGFLGEDGDLAFQLRDGGGIGVGGVGLTRRRVTKRGVATVGNGNGRGNLDCRIDNAGVPNGSGGTRASAATELSLEATRARMTVKAEGWVWCQGSGGGVAWARESTSSAGACLATIEVAGVTGANVAVKTGGVRIRCSEGPGLDGACLSTKIVVFEARTCVTEVTQAGSWRRVTRTRNPRMALVVIGATFWFGLSGWKRDGVGAAGATWRVKDVRNAGRIAARPSVGLAEDILDLVVGMGRLDGPIVEEGFLQNRVACGRLALELLDAISRALRLQDAGMIDGLGNERVHGASAGGRGGNGR
jgi:hypothetical protein